MRCKMKKTALFAAVLILAVLGFDVLQCAAGGARVYVARFAAGDIAVVDPVAWDAWGVIKTGKAPAKLKASADGKVVFVSLYGEDALQAIETGKDNVVRTIKVGNGPYAMDLSPDGGLLYVCNARAKSISVVDTKELKEIKWEATLGRTAVVRAAPDGRDVYAVNEDAPMQVMDSKTMEILSEVKIPAGVSDAVFSPDGGKLYLNSLRDGEVTVMGLEKLEPLGRIKSGGQGLAISKSGKELWFGGMQGRLVAYSLEENKTLAELTRDTDLTGLEIAFSPDGRFVLAGPAGTEGTSVYVYDAAKKEKVAETRVGGGAESILYVGGQ